MTKASGLGWAPQIPDHWEVVPLNYVANMGTGHTPDRNKPEYWQNCSIPWVTTPDVTRRPDSLAPLTETEQRISELGMKNSAAVLHPADTVMLSRTASVGYSVRIGRPMATTQAFVTWSPGPRLDARYLLLVLRAMRPEWQRLAYGSTHLTIYMPDLESLRIPLPPLQEQRRIADFLDAETARIDSVHEAMRGQVELLTERRMRTLDIVWENADEIPRKRLGYATSLVTSGSRGWGDFVGETGSIFFRSANLRRDGLDPNLSNLAYVQLPPSVFAEADRSRIEEGDVLVGITGANTGWVALADCAIAGGNVSQHVCLVRPFKKELMGRWLAYLIASPATQSGLMASQYGGTKTQLSLPDIRDLRIPVIPFARQREVVAQIDRPLQFIDEQRRLRMRQLALLAERRQGLITAAVTGQVDVSTASGRGIED